jgi:uncharacterized repeat protein (TIGR03803 family)
MKKLLVCFSLFVFHFSLVKAQYTVLHNFNSTDGREPLGSLISSASGEVLYGMTYIGGANSYGNIFSVDTDGTNFNDLFDFADTNGAEPHGALTLSASGNILYGMTNGGGAGYGVIFSLHTDGSNFKHLFSFGDTNGAYPYGNLLLTGNKLYGMAYDGTSAGYGLIFSIDTDGTDFKKLYVFNYTDGANPYGSLTLSADGKKFFGATFEGGAFGDGLVFSIDTNGTGFKDLLDFNGTNGDLPAYVSLSLSASGKVLYGTTSQGGAGVYGTVFSVDTDGTAYHDLVDFNNINGQYPECGVLLYDSLLYGMTETGGLGSGNLFSLDTNGSSFTNLISFMGNDGAYPFGPVIMVAGNLYGVAERGGANSDGVVFRYRLDTNIATSTGQLSVRMDPFGMGSGQCSVYPNPCNGIFTVVCHSERSEESVPIIHIFNVLGEQVLTETLLSAQGDNLIDLTGQSSGVYLYRVLAQDGSLIGEGKLIIQK